jgi:hypothetical protein
LGNSSIGFPIRNCPNKTQCSNNWVNLEVCKGGSLRSRYCQNCNKHVTLVTEVKDLAYEVLYDRPIAVTEGLMTNIVVLNL